MIVNWYVFVNGFFVIIKERGENVLIFLKCYSSIFVVKLVIIFVWYIFKV